MRLLRKFSYYADNIAEYQIGFAILLAWGPFTGLLQVLGTIVAIACLVFVTISLMAIFGIAAVFGVFYLFLYLKHLLKSAVMHTA